MNKKILVSALLAATMSFASNNLRVDFYGSQGAQCEYAPRFQIYNYLPTTNWTLKLYAYFSSNDGSDPTKDFKLNVDFPAQIEKVNGNVYRVVINYGWYPIGDLQTKDFGNPFSIKPSSSNRCYQPYTRNNYPYDIVLESSNGGYLSNSKHPTFNNRIGLLVDKDYVCPGFNGKKNYIHIDAEDTNPATKISSGSKNPKGVVIDDKKNPEFYYCPLRVSNMSLYQATYDYIVLKLDDECPSGSYEFVRYHDTEDNTPSNKVYGFMEPSVIQKDAKMYYCFVPAATKNGKSYPFASTYGIFANPTASSNISKSTLHVDDEDTRNNNSWNFFNLSDDYISRIKNIISGSVDTDYRIAWMTGSSATKEAASEAKPVVAENMVNAPIAAPSGVAIKGISRTAMNVELLSEGKVEINLIGVDGHSYASITTENLQPGSHSINWNSAKVPAGRYIMSVKQNGIASGKSIILK